MIISWLTGGLGNQMFQYAAGLALAHRRRTVLKLDVSWYREYAQYEAHNRYGLSCFNITEQFATQEEIDRVRGVNFTRIERWSAKLAKTLHFYRYARAFDASGRFHSAKGAAFYPEFLEVPDDSYIHGMWQSERFFESVADLLRLHFSIRYPAPADVRALLERIAGGPSAAVHFRRGDYANNPAFASTLGVVAPDYYRRAIELLRERCPGLTLYIFSDDIDAVEREFRPDGPHVFVRPQGPAWGAHETLRLMSACDHAIIANSTFSWWGAWLNPSPGKIVVAPQPWFATGEDHELVPAGWLRVAAPR